MPGGLRDAAYVQKSDSALVVIFTRQGGERAHV
jgi:hypothetical protein